MPSNNKKSGGLGAYPVHLLAVLAVVVLATLYLGQKVESSRLVGELERTELEIRQLKKERTKLKVAIALKKRRDTIVKQAREQLSMVPADGRAIDLVWNYAEKTGKE